MSHDPDGALAEFLRQHPLGYAPFRVLHIYLESGDDVMIERDEVPFLGSRLFPLLISGYVVLRRFDFLIRSLLGLSRSVVDDPDHVFTMTSDHEYKSYSFLEVATELQDRGESVLLLCSPASAPRRDEWEEMGLPATTFRELLGYCSLIALLRGFVESIKIVRQLRRLHPEAYAAAPTSLVVNVTVLEVIKRSALDGATNEPVVHTYAPMPYLLESTRRDRVLTYQHGMLLAHEDKIAMGYPYYVPLTYFIWGEFSREKVAARAHPDSTLIATGTPWHDHLADLSRERTAPPSVDVLFVSGSHGLVADAEHEEYEAVVSDLIDYCESTDLSLAVKLHPNESAGWYAERGWEEYVVDFDGILDALLDCRVAVTGWSSTMLESAALGTPMVVIDSLREPSIADQLDVDGVHFTDAEGFVERVDALLETEDGDGDATVAPSYVTGQSVERIVEVAFDRSRSG